MNTTDASAPRLMIPALSGLYRTLAPYSYALMRVALGAILIPHGYVKLFMGGVQGLAAGGIGGLQLQPALAWAYLVGGIEFFGAILLAIGLFTRPVALIIFVEMAVIVFGVHWPQGYFWTTRGVEYPLLMGLMALAICFRGGDQLSVDRAIGREI